MGGVNSQVLMNETEIEEAVRDLRALLDPSQVRRSRFCPLQTGAASPFDVFGVFLSFWR